jgi:hypothetical protein
MKITFKTAVAMLTAAQTIGNGAEVAGLREVPRQSTPAFMASASATTSQLNEHNSEDDMSRNHMKALALARQAINTEQVKH